MNINTLGGGKTFTIPSGFIENDVTSASDMPSSRVEIRKVIGGSIRPFIDEVASGNDVETRVGSDVKLLQLRFNLLSDSFQAEIKESLTAINPELWAELESQHTQDEDKAYIESYLKQLEQFEPTISQQETKKNTFWTVFLAPFTALFDLPKLKPDNFQPEGFNLSTFELFFIKSTRKVLAEYARDTASSESRGKDE